MYVHVSMFFDIHVLNCLQIDLNRDGQLSYLEFLCQFGIMESAEGHAWLKSNHRY